VTYPWTLDAAQFFDPLENTSQCELDARLIEALGANVISADYINASANHNGCINAFASKNIYLLVSLMSAESDVRPEIYNGTDFVPDLEDVT
jgi:Glucanosyltransferase